MFAILLLMRSLFAILLAALLVFGVFGSVNAQSDRVELGKQAFRSGDYKSAVEHLRSAAKGPSMTADVWSLLGTAYIRTDKLKDAAKAFQQAVKLQPEKDVYYANLAYAYLLLNDKKADGTVRKALSLNPTNADALFVAGRRSLSKQDYQQALEYANTLIEAHRSYPPSYLLKADILITRYTAQLAKDEWPYQYAAADTFPEISDLHERFMKLSNPAIQDFYGERIATFKVFGEFFGRKENRRSKTPLGTPKATDPDIVPFKIIKKHTPSYTESARQKGISGTVILMVMFRADGTIGPILTLKSLDPGLDYQAIQAAKAIKFSPETRKGVPEAVVRNLEYTFEVR